MGKAERIVFFALAFALTLSICQCHLASVVQSSAEIRPGLNQIADRVARGPSIRLNEEEQDFPFTHILSDLRQKMPAFHNRFTPNKNSVLYHNAPGTLSMAQLSPFNIQGPTDPAASMSDEQELNSDRSNDNSPLDQEEAPTFTPFIGARALSNMGKFFEHLRENLVAMQQEGSGEIGQPERRMRLTSGEIDEASESAPEISSSESRRILSQAMGPRWTPPATGSYRDLARYPSQGTRTGQKYQAFIQPMSEQEAYLRKANNYNPSWLWTNMGLGRRR